MATVNQVGVGLSGASGTGAFAGNVSPSFTTPALGTPSSGVLTNCTGLPVAGGGTGLSAVTAHYLMIGNGTSALTLLAPSATVGLPLLSAGASSDPAYGVLQVVGGGTGVNTWTTYSIVFTSTTATGNLVSNPSGLGTSGQTLISQGAGAYPIWSTGKPITQVVTQVITASGANTYTPTTGMVYCIAEIVGGGGGGGAVPITTAASASGGGGGGGGYSRKTMSAATVGASQTVTIGAGGAGGTAGSNPGSTGTSTTFGAIFSAAGGTGGEAGATVTTAYQVDGGFPGVGGVGSGGDINLFGLTGTWGTNNFALSNARGGLGGASYIGQGGQRAIYNVVGSGAAAPANTGTGGSGAGLFNNGTARAGGAGGSGICIVTEFISV